MDRVQRWGGAPQIPRPFKIWSSPRYLDLLSSTITLHSSLPPQSIHSVGHCASRFHPHPAVRRQLITHPTGEVEKNRGDDGVLTFFHLQSITFKNNHYIYIKAWIHRDSTGFFKHLSVIYFSIPKRYCFSSLSLLSSAAVFSERKHCCTLSAHHQTVDRQNKWLAGEHEGAAEVPGISLKSWWKMKYKERKVNHSQKLYCM